MAWTNPETFTAGQTLTAASMNAISENTRSLARGYIARAELSASQSGITTTTDLTGGSVTFTAEANRYYRIFGSVLVGASGANTAAQLAIREGSTTHAASISSIVNGEYETIIASRVMTFSAGSKTLKLSLLRQSGAGTLLTIIDATARPDYLLIEDIGPA